MDREDLAELFSAFGPVSVRRVFSGFGLYAEDVCFSLFLRGELYLKTDETTAPRFAAEGSRPFSYTQQASGKVVVVNSFWRLPERLYDDPEDLAEWARMAVATAHRLKLGKGAHQRKRVKKPSSQAAASKTKKAGKPTSRKPPAKSGKVRKPARAKRR